MSQVLKPVVQQQKAEETARRAARHQAGRVSISEKARMAKLEAAIQYRESQGLPLRQDDLARDINVSQSTIHEDLQLRQTNPELGTKYLEEFKDRPGAMGVAAAQPFSGPAPALASAVVRDTNESEQLVVLKCLERLLAGVEAPAFALTFARADFLEGYGQMIAQVLELANRIATIAGIDVPAAMADGTLHHGDDPREEARQTRLIWALSRWGFTDGERPTVDEIAAEFAMDPDEVDQAIRRVDHLANSRRMPAGGAVPDLARFDVAVPIGGPVSNGFEN